MSKLYTYRETTFEKNNRVRKPIFMILTEGLNASIAFFNPADQEFIRHTGFKILKGRLGNGVKFPKEYQGKGYKSVVRPYLNKMYEYIGEVFCAEYEEWKGLPFTETSQYRIQYRSQY